MNHISKNKEDRIRREYFEWLCNLASVERSGYTYYFLFNDLHLIDFFTKIERDNNRVEDGLQLRKEFGCEDILTGPCSVLEMIIALARRMDGIMYDNEIGPEPDYWFWRMMENLGLDRYFDCEEYISEDKNSEIQNIICTLLERRYSWNGRGGLFPLKDNGYLKDQRKVEIWYQMQSYLVEENYDANKSF